MVKRKRDLKLAAEYRAKNCIICQTNIGVSGHHLKSFGSGGLCEEANLIPVCIKHHSEFHDKGLSNMAHRFHTVFLWLKKHRWEYDGFRNRWFHKEENDD